MSETTKTPTADELAALATAGGVAKFDDDKTPTAKPKAATAPKPPEAAKPAAKPKPAPTVERFKVRETCRYVNNGVVVSWPKGMVIDSLNFNLADVRAQGIPLDPATEADIDSTPAFGHRSV